MVYTFENLTDSKKAYKGIKKSELEGHELKTHFPKICPMCLTTYQSFEDAIARMDPVEGGIVSCDVYGRDDIHVYLNCKGDSDGQECGSTHLIICQGQPLQKVG